MDNSWQRCGSGPYGDYGDTNTPSIDLTLPCYDQNISQQGVECSQLGQNTQAEGSNQATAKRDKNYVNSEDKIICSTFLNVSRDPIVGVSQSMGTYWTRITKYFNEFRRTPIAPSLQSLQKRWGDIQKETSKFCAYYAEIQRLNQIGKSEDDKIKDAHEMYQRRNKGKQFKFIHCWFILRNEQKWNEYVAGLLTAETTSPTAQPSPSTEAEPAETAPDRRTYERPIGRDRTKKQRTSSTSIPFAASCFEHFQWDQSK